MTTTENGAEPIACTLTDPERQERRRQLAGGVLSRIAETRELSDGYALRFTAAPGVVEELGAFIAFESACCRFLDFGLEVKASDGPVWMKLTGPGEAKTFVRQMLEGGVELLQGGVEQRSGAGVGPAASARSGRLIKAGAVGMSAGAVALVCCVTPMLAGAAAVLGIGAASLGGYLDAFAAPAILLGGAMLAAGFYARRKKAVSGCSDGC